MVALLVGSSSIAPSPPPDARRGGRPSPALNGVRITPAPSRVRQSDKVDYGDRQTVLALPEVQRALRKKKRQTPQSADGYPDCNYQDAARLTCFPTTGALLVQDVWSKVVFNAQQPLFIAAGEVDIHLFHAGSEDLRKSWLRVSAARGTLGILPDDDWLEDQTSWTDGLNRTFPFFFVVVPANVSLTGGEVHQSTFSMVQTRAPQSLIASSLASVSSAASLSSFASSTSAAGLQSHEGGGGLPKWGIAVISVLAFVTFISATLSCWALFTMARRRKSRSSIERRRGSAATADTEKTGMGSDTMLVREGDRVEKDGTRRSKDSQPPLSDIDAAFMASAYRNVLRRPSFDTHASQDTPSTPGNASQGIIRPKIFNRRSVALDIETTGSDDQHESDRAEESPGIVSHLLSKELGDETIRTVDEAKTVPPPR